MIKGNVKSMFFIVVNQKLWIRVTLLYFLRSPSSFRALWAGVFCVWLADFEVERKPFPLRKGAIIFERLSQSVNTIGISYCATLPLPQWVRSQETQVGVPVVELKLSTVQRTTVKWHTCHHQPLFIGAFFRLVVSRWGEEGVCTCSAF